MVLFSMSINRFIFGIFSSFLAFTMPMLNNAFAAENIYKNPAEKNHKVISVYENNWSYDINTQFEITASETTNSDTGTPRELLKSVETPEDEKRSATARFIEEANLEDKILSKVPHGSRIKHIWNIVDGDVDLYFTGLRADKGNRGITYTTTNLPVIGKINDMKFEFSAGETNEISFTTHVIPFMGELKGFTLKGTAGDDDNKIFARYTVPFE